MARTKKYIVFIIILLIFPTLVQAFEAMVVGVLDGDSIIVMRDGKQIEIRLAAVDCPEKGQPYSNAARKFTATLVSGRFVDVEKVDTDSYGRIVAFVSVGDVNVNKALLEAGLAWHYKKYSNSYVLDLLESEARSNQSGLWTEPDPEPPWEYRRRNP